MSKHRVIIYPKINRKIVNETRYDYADNFSQGILLNHRPMQDDIITLFAEGYPYSVVKIEDLILLFEERAEDQSVSYWHAYCQQLEFDFSAIPYYGKEGDAGKLAAHAIDQRATQIHRYGPPPAPYDMNEYKSECRRHVDYLIENFDSEIQQE